MSSINTPNTSSENLLRDIENFKNTYYTENRKCFFFKKSQKMDCATKIAQEFNLDDLLQQTVFLIPNTNRVFIDYTIFKLYANPENYSQIVSTVIGYFQTCIENYGSFECHLNLNSFTVTAAERYKHIIEMFCKECLKSETRYAKLMTKMYIYYSPSMVERITTLFTHLIDPYIRDRFILYSKDESEEKLAILAS